MKLVVTADMHIHPRRLCSRDGGHDRLLDGLSALRQTLDLARSLRAAWVFAGDFKLPKTNWPQEALTGAHEILREFPDVEKLMVCGNHDAEGVGGSGLAPFADVATVVDRPRVVMLRKTVPIACAPWNADLAEVRKISGGKVLVAHGYLLGARLGPDDVRLPGKGHAPAEYGDFEVAFFGDIHKGQVFRPGDPATGMSARWDSYDADDSDPIVHDGAWKGHVFYPGSPYQQNLGERNDGPKGALVVDLATRVVRLAPVSAPRYVKVEMAAATRSGSTKVNTEDWAGNFVTVVCDPRAVAAVRAAGEGVPTRSLQVITRRDDAPRSAVEVHAGMDRTELLQKYIAARPPAEGLDADKVLEAGLRLFGVPA